MRFSATLVALSAAAVSAQTQNYTSSLDMTIDPGSIDDIMKSEWCRAQDNTCRTLCSARASTNDCDPTDLSYECLCSSNDSAPGLQYYRQTMPTFICSALREQCIRLNENNADGQEECEDNIQVHCGTQAPPSLEDVEEEEEEEEETSTTAAPSSSPTSNPDDDDGDDGDSEDNVSTTDSDGLAAPTAAPKAVGALAAIGLVAAFI